MGSLTSTFLVQAASAQRQFSLRGHLSRVDLVLNEEVRSDRGCPARRGAGAREPRRLGNYLLGLGRRGRGPPARCPDGGPVRASGAR